MIKKISVLVLILSMLTVSVFAAPSSWAVSEVNTAVKEELVPDVLLSDYQSYITREEFCLMAVKLYKALSGAEAPKGEVAFSDTKSEEVMAAYSLGIVNGIGDGKFAPAALITREEIATMFYRTINAALPSLEKPEKYVNSVPDFKDVSDWAREAVLFVNLCEVMMGDDDGKINPKHNTTREQAIAMTLRIYNAFKVVSLDPMVSLMFSTSGNTTSNMHGGAFAIKSLYGGMYYSDNNGVYAEDGEVITKNKALAIYPDTNGVYYIKADDKCLYKVSGGRETLIAKDCVAFSVSGEYIYIKSENGTLRTIKGGNETIVANNTTSVPMASTNGVYYADGKGIYLVKNSGETENVYLGAATEAILSSGVFYFKNAEGFVCKVDTNGEKYGVITPSPVDRFIIYGGGIVYTADGLYKCAINGRFNIKLLEEKDFSLNSYSNDIYLKYENGDIFKLNTYTAVKSAVN